MDAIPLFWLFVLVSAPVLSLVCVVALWRQKASAWLVALATLLLLPQCYAWYFAVIMVLYYSGVVR